MREPITVCGSRDSFSVVVRAFSLSSCVVRRYVGLMLEGEAFFSQEGVRAFGGALGTQVGSLASFALCLDATSTRLCRTHTQHLMKILTEQEYSFTIQKVQMHGRVSPVSWKVQ